MIWWKVVLVLCVFGFLKEFRPSDPFISPFLNGPWKNFSETTINRDIYPVGTYSSMPLLIVVFLLTDWLRYKPIIILEGFSGIITWSLLTFGQGIPIMQVSQFFYGLFSVTEIAYFSYMYAKIDKKHYQRATSQTKTALLVGKASSGLVSQALVTFELMDYEQLNYISLGALVLCTMWAFALPPVAQSTYFHRLDSKEVPHDIEEIDRLKNSQEVEITAVDIKQKDRFNCDCMTLVADIKSAVKDEHIIKWSIWWALSMCGYLQVTFYMQLLWQAIINESEGQQLLYHGYSNSAHSLIGAVCTYLVGYLKLKWDLCGEVALALCSLLQGGLLLYSARMTHLFTGYFLYITYRVLYQTSNAIASSEIAKHIKADSYALIFGINTFAALLGQSLLTFVAIEFLELDIRTQFVVYGSYYLVMGAGFTVAGAITIIKLVRNKQKTIS